MRADIIPILESTQPATGMETLAGLPGFRATAKQQWEARCPGHEDRKASLAIGIGNDGRILLHCHAGCDLARILEAAGISQKDLFANNGHEPQERRIIATYDYQTGAGELSYQVVRYEPKDFRQRRPDGNGWIWNIAGLKRIPYHLPELAGAEYVFVVEGEKDVDALRALGLAATCNSGGAGKWTSELSQYFKPNQHITIIPDNDESGRKHAQQVAASLHGKVASVKVLELPGLGDKGDVSDWLKGRDPEAAAEELSRLAEAAPEWKPVEPATAGGWEPPEHWEIRDGGHPEQWECPETKWAAAGLFARGSLVIVAGESQVGKTLITLSACRQLLTGPKLFEHFDVQPLDRIFYLVLEDPPQRIKSRLLDAARAGEPEIGLGRLDMAFWPGFSLSEAEHFALLESSIKQKQYDMVVLDTFQRATPGVLSYDDEKLSIILHRLSAMTRRYDVILWINDHLRKAMEKARGRRELSQADIKGSTVKLQNADCYLLVSRNGPRLQITGSNKDADGKIGFLLDLAAEGDKSKPKFCYAGELENLAAASRSKGTQTAAKILEIMEPGAWVSCGDLAPRTPFSPSTVRSHLERLVQGGKVVEQGEKRWKRYRRIDEITELAIDGDRIKTTESKTSIASSILPFKETTIEGRAEAALSEPLPTKGILSLGINSSPIGAGDRKTVDRKGGNE